jgi:hypothetical protein
MNITDFYNIMLSLQCNFNKDLCDTVFGNESNHLYPKWIASHGNIIHFMTMLDSVNRKNLLDYVVNNST